ncbi:MAG: DUF885 family protein, partial [Planctomycetota bacterium]|nr:DUF885 family protein [Planctomycetota bacterium]
MTTTTTTRIAVAVTAALFAAAAPLHAQSPAPDEAVRALLDEDLAAQDRGSPIAASIRGNREYDHLLPDVSPEAYARRRADSEDRLRRLLAIDRAALSEDARLSADLLEYELRDRIAVAPFHPEQSPITPQGGPHIFLPPRPDPLSFTVRGPREDYLARLEAI